MQALTKETQSKITPDEAIQMLKDGNQRFVDNKPADRDLLEQVKQTANQQAPFATILSCMDSRTSVELTFDQGIGDVFSIRVAGNVSSGDVLGSIEYATKAVGTKVLLVLGHTKCGAVTGACNHVEMDNLTALLQKIQPAIDNETETKENRTGTNENFVHNVIINNVHHTIEEIRKNSPIVAEFEAKGLTKVIGGLYDVGTGEVTFFD